MTWRLPDWWQFVLLGLASYRVWALLSEDTILLFPRERAIFLIRKRSNKWATSLRDGLECPWCFGFWIALAWWFAFELWPHGTPIVAVPFALSVVVGALGQHLNA